MLCRALKKKAVKPVAEDDDDHEPAAPSRDHISRTWTLLAKEWVNRQVVSDFVVLCSLS